MGVIDRLKVVAIATLLRALAVAYGTDGGPVLAVLEMGLAAWLFVGALVEWAGRIKLFRAPLRNSLARAAGLPSAAHGMTPAGSAEPTSELQSLMRLSYSVFCLKKTQYLIYITNRTHLTR